MSDSPVLSRSIEASYNEDEISCLLSESKASGQEVPVNALGSTVEPTDIHELDNRVLWCLSVLQADTIPGTLQAAQAKEEDIHDYFIAHRAARFPHRTKKQEPSSAPTSASTAEKETTPSQAAGRKERGSNSNLDDPSAVGASSSAARLLAGEAPQYRSSSNCDRLLLFRGVGNRWKRMRGVLSEGILRLYELNTGRNHTLPEGREEEEAHLLEFDGIDVDEASPESALKGTSVAAQDHELEIQKVKEEEEEEKSDAKEKGKKIWKEVDAGEPSHVLAVSYASVRTSASIEESGKSSLKVKSDDAGASSAAACAGGGSLLGPYRKQVVRVFCARVCVDIAGVNEEEWQAWERAFRKTIAHKFGRHEATLQAKKRASALLSPCLRHQRRIERDHCLALRSALETTGLVSRTTYKKIHAGYLKKRTDAERNNWIDCYCVLSKAVLPYFDVSDKRLPLGAIPIRYACCIRVASSSHNRRFVITTPKGDYVWRARHEVSCNEWINAIREVRSGLQKGTPAPTKLVSVAEHEKLEGEAIDGTPVLVYTAPNGKNKKYKITKSVVTVGRSNTNSLRINDPKISRVHIKLIHNSDEPVQLLDLGSWGTYVNEVKVEKKVLEPGDKIRLGHTEILFDVQRRRGRISLFSSGGSRQRESLIKRN